MTSQASARLALEDEPLNSAAFPQVFVRAFSVPAGAPWEQIRAANLEARHGAPLPIGELMLRVQRLEGWRPRAPGRYGAFYIRSREYRIPFETSVEVDGSSHKVSFGRSADQAERLQRLAVVGGAGLATAAVAALALSFVSVTKVEGDARLEALEIQAEQRLRAARAYQRQKDLARELESAIGSSARLDDVLKDFSWVTTSKAPDARILAVHWGKGLLAIETRGDGVPFTAPDRRVERLEKPLKPGVWLWGVGPPGSGDVRRGASQ